MAERSKLEQRLSTASQDNRNPRGKGFHRASTPSIKRPSSFQSASERKQAKANKGGSWTDKDTGRARRRDARRAQREQGKNK